MYILSYFCKNENILFYYTKSYVILYYFIKFYDVMNNHLARVSHNQHVYKATEPL
jgi:hypothetical protein